MGFDQVGAIDGIVILVLSSPFYFFFMYYDQPFRGFIAALSAGVIMSLVWLLRSIANNSKFWLGIFIIVLIHVMLIYFLPYTGEFRFGFVFFPLVFADIVIFGRILLFVCNAGGGKPS